MGQGEVSISAEQDAAFDGLSKALGGQLARAHQKPPFPGGPARCEWRVTWSSNGSGGRLVASAVEMDGARTDSSWISLEDGALDATAWVRVASRSLADLCLGERLPHRRGKFDNAELDGAFVIALPPGPSEWSALYGPSPSERDLRATVLAAETLVSRWRRFFPDVLPRLQSLGDFVVEVQDGTFSVRFATLFVRPEPYRRVIECVQKMLEAARAV